MSRNINGHIVDDKFFLEGIKFDLDPSLSWTPLDTKNNSPVGCIIHHTCGDKFEGDYGWIKNDGVSVQVLVGREEGEIVQFAPLNMRCPHAGKSEWDINSDGHIDSNENNLNLRFVGIEFTGLGPLTKQGNKLIDCWGKEYTGKVQERVIAGYRFWQEFTPWQNRMLREIPLRMISQLGTFDYTDVAGHYEVSPGRKNDPAGGPDITMPQLRDYLKNKTTQTTPVSTKKYFIFSTPKSLVDNYSKIGENDKSFLRIEKYGKCVVCGVEVPAEGNMICSKCKAANSENIVVL